jgi:hypothetical protein
MTGNSGAAFFNSIICQFKDSAGNAVTNSVFPRIWFSASGDGICGQPQTIAGQGESGFTVSFSPVANQSGIYNASSGSGWQINQAGQHDYMVMTNTSGALTFYAYYTGATEAWPWVNIEYQGQIFSSQLDLYFDPT